MKETRLDITWVASDGFTYEREAIEKWFETSGNSPRTGALLQHKILILNICNTLMQGIIARIYLQQGCLKNCEDILDVQLQILSSVQRSSDCASAATACNNVLEFHSSNGTISDNSQLLIEDYKRGRKGIVSNDGLFARKVLRSCHADTFSVNSKSSDC
jgi:hypothetical protein